MPAFLWLVGEPGQLGIGGGSRCRASLRAMELVSLHLHLMDLVVALDIEASHDGKAVGAK